MARDRSPIVKQSRREGVALAPKAYKVMARKTGIPGQHAQGRRGRSSLYLTQLREKQKVRRMYGLLEKQFARTMKEAEKGVGMAGEKLLVLLERRLDNVIFRAGFATTRRGSRQLVSHGNFLLNGKRVDIPSIRVKVGDEITVRPKSQKNGYFKALPEIVKDAAVQKSGWLSVNVPKMTVKVTGLPARTDIVEDINEQLIVEYYSR